MILFIGSIFFHGILGFIQFANFAVIFLLQIKNLRFLMEFCNVSQLTREAQKFWHKRASLEGHGTMAWQTSWASAITECFFLGESFPAISLDDSNNSSENNWDGLKFWIFQISMEVHTIETQHQRLLLTIWLDHQSGFLRGSNISSIVIDCKRRDFIGHISRIILQNSGQKFNNVSVGWTMIGSYVNWTGAINNGKLQWTRL